MATIAGINDRVRLELADQAQSFQATLLGDGASRRYELGVYPLMGSTLVIAVDGLDVSSSSGVEERTGVLVLAAVPDAGAVITVAGNRFRYFCDTDLTLLTQAAVTQHLYNRNDSFGRALTVSNLPVVEEYPVALLAAIEALYALATDASFDIDIIAPDGVNIPRSERYRQLMDMIQSRREQYQTLCEALNIGLHKIEVFTFRRISRMTNRYIPVYQPQEVDDSTKPVRVYLPAPTYGGTPIPTSAGIFDLVFTQGDAFSITMDFPFSLADFTPKAQIRVFSESQIIAAELTVAAVAGEPDKIELSLTPLQTSKLPLRSVWDMQLTETATGKVETYVKGQVFVDRQTTRTPGVDTSVSDNSPFPPWLAGDAQEGFTPTTPPGN